MGTDVKAGGTYVKAGGTDVEAGGIGAGVLAVAGEHFVMGHSSFLHSG